MGEFNLNDLPSSILDGFDPTTALPKGPLEKLPIPVDGTLIGARATTPIDFSNIWTATVACDSDLNNVIEFYLEYLPLSGYDILATGTQSTGRKWFGLMMPKNREIIVIRHGLHLGCIYIERRKDGATLVNATMAERTHPDVTPFTNANLVRLNPDVVWHH